MKSCSYTTWLLCRHSVHPGLSTHNFRHYGSETALQQHLRDTPVHARECESPAGAARLVEIIGKSLRVLSSRTAIFTSPSIL